MDNCLINLYIDNLNSPPGGSPLQVKNFDFNAYVGLLAG